MDRRLLYSKIKPILIIIVILFLCHCRNSFLRFNWTVNRHNTIKLFNQIRFEQDRYKAEHKVYANNFSQININYEKAREALLYPCFLLIMNGDKVMPPSIESQVRIDMEPYLKNIDLSFEDNSYSVLAVYKIPTLETPEIIFMNKSGDVKLVSSSFIGSLIFTWDACEFYFVKGIKFRYCARNNDIVLAKLK